MFFLDSQSNFQILLIDISKHLTELSTAMLKKLLQLTNYSILLFDYPPLVDFNTLPQKSTLLFVSSEFASTMEEKNFKYIKAVFILESDKKKVNQRERFGTIEDLIYQLVDEVYRHYKQEAKSYFMSKDSSIAKIKESQANQVHIEMKKIYQCYIKCNSRTTVSTVSTETTLIWVTSISQDKNVIKKIQHRFDKIVSSFRLFESKSEYQSYVLENKFAGDIFLIISIDPEDSMAVDFQHLSNVKAVYHYGLSLVKNGTNITNYDDLCLRLACDLISHYNKLGDDCNAKQNAKAAKDMFMKAHELCKILDEL